MKRLTLEERITNLKSNYNLLFSFSKDELQGKVKNFSYNLYETQYLIDNEAIEKAKRMINFLTEELSNCRDIENIKKLRRRINYYIDKIKKELKKRDVSQSFIDEYYNSTLNLKKAITKHVRVAKRQKNIDKIEKLASEFSALLDNDKKSLRKLLKNEQEYVKRNLLKYLEAEEKENKMVEPEPEVTVEPSNKKKKFNFQALATRVASLFLAGTISISALVAGLSYEKSKKKLGSAVAATEILSLVKSNILENEEVEVIEEEKPIIYKQNEDVTEDILKELNPLYSVTYTKVYESSHDTTISKVTEGSYGDAEIAIEPYGESELTEASEVTIDDKIEYIMQTDNIKSKSDLQRFCDSFIKTMSKYGYTYTYEDIINILYEVACTSLEEKIEYIKNYFGITDEQLNKVAATFGGEGIGGGERYEDVFSAATTGINRTQFAKWIASIATWAGEENKTNIYYATCYKPQFSAFEGKWYYILLDNRECISFLATVDAIYINLYYHVYFQDYTEFNMPSATSKGEQFLTDGNRYYTEYPAEARIEPASKEFVLKRIN